MSLRRIALRIGAVAVPALLLAASVGGYLFLAQGGMAPLRVPAGGRDAAPADAATLAQYLVPYFIASHPGSDLAAMIDLAVFLKRSGYKPDQVQDFIPAPFDVATAMYHTGIGPFTRKPVHVAKHLRDRKLQRALMQFFKPENYFEVREALIEAVRRDLIGGGACKSQEPIVLFPFAMKHPTQ